MGRAGAAVRAGSALLCRAHGEPALRGRARRPASCAHAGHWHPLATRTAALSHRHPCCVDTCVQCRCHAAVRGPHCLLRTVRTCGTGRLAPGGTTAPPAPVPTAPYRVAPEAAAWEGDHLRCPHLWCPWEGKRSCGAHICHLSGVVRGVHHLSPATTPVSTPRRVSTTGDQRVAAVPLASGTQLSCTAVPAPHLKPGAVAISTDATTCVDTYLRHRAARPRASSTSLCSAQRGTRARLGCAVHAAYRVAHHRRRPPPPPRSPTTTSPSCLSSRP